MAVDPALLQTMQADAMAGRLLGRLEADRIDAILLKGSTLSSLYPDRNRTYVDIDVLVQEPDLPAVQRHLEALGYSVLLPGVRENERVAHATAWGHGNMPPVDLHTTIPGVGVAPARLWETLWAATEAHAVAGRRCRRLATHARALHLALHAAQSGVGTPKPMEDLMRGLLWLDEDVWRGAARLAHELDALGAFATGLSLTPTGEAIAARLGVVGAATSVEARLAAGSAPRGAVSLARVAAQRGALRKLWYSIGRVFPSPAVLRWEEPVAARGGVWLAAGYGVRIVHVVQRLPAALQAYRRERSAGRGVD